MHINKDQLYVPGAWSSDEASSAVTTPGSLSPIGGRTPGTLSPIGGRSPKPVRGGFGKYLLEIVVFLQDYLMLRLTS